MKTVFTKPPEPRNSFPFLCGQDFILVLCISAGSKSTTLESIFKMVGVSSIEAVAFYLFMAVLSVIGVIFEIKIQTGEVLTMFMLSMVINLSACWPVMTREIESRCIIYVCRFVMVVAFIIQFIFCSLNFPSDLSVSFTILSVLGITMGLLASFIIMHNHKQTRKVQAQNSNMATVLSDAPVIVPQIRVMVVSPVPMTGVEKTPSQRGS